jgi:hypothetical protein
MFNGCIILLAYLLPIIMVKAKRKFFKDKETRQLIKKKFVTRKDDLQSLQVAVWRYSYPASHQPFSFITFRKENDDN